MRRGFAAAALVGASGAAAGLGYYLTVTGKLTADTGWDADSARSARSVCRSAPGRRRCST